MQTMAPRCCFLFLILILNTGTDGSKPANISSSSKLVPKLNQHFQQNIVDGYFKTLNDRYQNLTRNLTISHISTVCRRSLDLYFQDPFQHDWSLKMWDSNGHLPSGLLSGTFFHPGDFDQCLSVMDPDDEDIGGKYCILEIKLPINQDDQMPEVFDDPKLDDDSLGNYEQWNKVIDFLVRWNHFSGVDNGICVPSACTDWEINQIVPQVLIPVELNLQVRTKLCQSKPTELANLPLRFGQKITLTILIAHFLLVATGTILSMFESEDQAQQSGDSGIVPFLLCFSIITSTRTLFKISHDNSNRGQSLPITDHRSPPVRGGGQLKFIHGIKVLSIYWIIIAHVFLFYPFLNLEDRVSPVHSLEKRTKIIKNPFTHFIVNAGLAVETFFLISGALTIFTVSSHQQQNKSINLFQYVLLRWLRFSPAVLGALCLLTLWPRIGDGPLFHRKHIDFITEPCYNNWWISFAYIANLFPSDQVCNVMHWYLSADFQLHVLLYLVIFLHFRWPSLNIIYMTIMSIVGFIVPILIVLIGWASAPNPSIFLHPTHQFPMDKVETFIFATYNHLIPYFIGAFLGLLMVRPKSLQISTWIRWIIRLILLPLFLALPFGSYSFVGTTEPVDAPLQSAITFGVVRIIWSMGVFWLCLEFIQNRLQWLSGIMEHDFFQPFSRLTFCIYLVHILPIWHYMFTIRTPIEVSLYNLLFIGMGNAVLSTLLAYLLYCFFEQPYARIIKLFLV